MNDKQECERIEAEMFRIENGKALREVLPNMKDNIFLAIFLELKKKSKDKSKKQLFLRRSE